LSSLRDFVNSAGRPCPRCRCTGSIHVRQSGGLFEVLIGRHRGAEVLAFVVVGAVGAVVVLVVVQHDLARGRSICIGRPRVFCDGKNRGVARHFLAKNVSHVFEPVQGLTGHDIRAHHNASASKCGFMSMNLEPVRCSSREAWRQKATLTVNPVSISALTAGT